MTWPSDELVELLAHGGGTSQYATILSSACTLEQHTHVFRGLGGVFLNVTEVDIVNESTASRSIRDAKRLRSCPLILSASHFSLFLHHPTYAHNPSRLAPPWRLCFYKGPSPSPVSFQVPSRFLPSLLEAKTAGMQTKIFAVAVAALSMASVQGAIAPRATIGPTVIVIPQITINPNELLPVQAVFATLDLLRADIAKTTELVNQLTVSTTNTLFSVGFSPALSVLADERSC